MLKLKRPEFQSRLLRQCWRQAILSSRGLLVVVASRTRIVDIGQVLSYISQMIIEFKLAFLLTLVLYVVVSDQSDRIDEIIAASCKHCGVNILSAESKQTSTYQFGQHVSVRSPIRGQIETSLAK
jgi:hypothetical protein